jgi:hypothetical protein
MLVLLRGSEQCRSASDTEADRHSMAKRECSSLFVLASE